MNVSARGTHSLETEWGATCQNTEGKRPRKGTHFLETAERGTCHDTYRRSLSEGNSLAGDGRGRVLSEHRKKPTERGVLTFWIWQREGLVRVLKQTD